MAAPHVAAVIQGGVPAAPPPSLFTLDTISNLPYREMCMRCLKVRGAGRFGAALGLPCFSADAACCLCKLLQALGSCLSLLRPSLLTMEQPICPDPYMRSSAAWENLTCRWSQQRGPSSRKS